MLLFKELYPVSDFPKHSKSSNSDESDLELIRREHQSYVRTISSPEMAMSLELAIFIFEWCVANEPKTVLDLGSGFSSFIFRLYQKKAKNTVIVWSVDDHDEWLEKTRSYLEEKQVNTDKLLTLNTFLTTETAVKFDCILLDLNFVEIRKDYIQTSMDRLKKNGLLIIDDVHKVEFLRSVKSAALKNSGTLQKLTRYTKDRFGRFAIGYKHADHDRT